MKLFVWDFHGVLEKGTERASIEVSNAVINDFGYVERFSDDDMERLYGRKWYEYFEDMLPNEPHERHIELQEAAFAYDVAHPEIVAGVTEPNDHAQEVVRAIARQHDQVVISNTKPEALKRFVELVGIADVFTPERSLAVDRHARDARRTKADVLREYVARHPANELVFIGDTPADMAFATEVGGVGYHYVHPGRAFQSCESDFRIHDLRAVLASL